VSIADAVVLLLAGLSVCIANAAVGEFTSSNIAHNLDHNIQSRTFSHNFYF
jgi:hypothetical protein